MTSITTTKIIDEADWFGADDANVPQATKYPYVQLAFGRYRGEDFVRESPFIMCREILALLTMAPKIGAVTPYGRFKLDPAWLSHGSKVMITAARDEEHSGKGPPSSLPEYSEQLLAAMMQLNCWEELSGIPLTKVLSSYELKKYRRPSNLGIIVEIDDVWLDSPMGISYYILLLRTALHTVVKGRGNSFIAAAEGVDEASCILNKFYYSGIGNPTKFLYNALPAINEGDPYVNDITIEEYDNEEDGELLEADVPLLGNTTLDAFVGTLGITSQLIGKQQPGTPQGDTQARLRHAMLENQALRPHAVAVYGTLRSGECNHRLLANSNAELAWEGISRQKFAMFGLSSYFPYLVPRTHVRDVYLEVYNVDDATFASLDILEGYPQHYNRKQVKVRSRDAWIYFAEEDQISQQGGRIEGGDWKNRH